MIYTNGCLDTEQVKRFVEGRMTEDEHAAAERHTNACIECTEQVVVQIVICREAQAVRKSK